MGHSCWCYVMGAGLRGLDSGCAMRPSRFLAVVIESVTRLGAQSCLTLLGPHGRQPSSPSAQGILQARILGWVACPFSRGSSQPMIEPGSPALQEDSSPLSRQGSLPICPPCLFYSEWGEAPSSPHGQQLSMGGMLLWALSVHTARWGFPALLLSAQGCPFALISM